MSVWETLITGAAGGLLASTVFESIKAKLKRRSDQQNLCAAGLVDVGSTLRAVRSLYEQLELVSEPTCLADLVTYPSDFTVRPSAIPLAKYVAELDDQRAVRHAILMFDALEALTQYSAEHRKACEWLLEKESWDSDAGRERVLRLNHYRTSSRFQLARALCHGHELVADLFALAHETGSTSQYLQDELELTKARAEQLAERFAERAQALAELRAESARRLPEPARAPC